MWKRFLLGGVLIFVLSVAVVATAALEQFQQIADILPKGGARIVSSDLTPSEAGAPQTIMVIGSDKRARATAIQDRLSPPHSDTLMLIRMDPNKGQTSILSIPRDLRITIHPFSGAPSTQKVNAAYSIGGAKLTLRTVTQLLGIRINHVVDVNFTGFRRIVDATGCVYVDVDRRYYHSNLGLGTGQQYSEINIQPGYQKLCDQTALAYVRYRHTDSDFTRVARQQDFVRQIKEQVGVNGLLDKRQQILNAVGPAITTDIRGVSEVIRLTKLMAFSLSRPIRQVPFRSTPGPSYVIATRAQIQATVADFLGGGRQVQLPATPTRPPSGKGKHGRSAAPASTGGLGLVAAPRADKDALLSSAVTDPLALYYPNSQPATAAQDFVRTYDLRDEQNHLHHAYRVVFAANSALGEYYGMQGMDWMNPPLLAHAQKRTIDGRRYLFVNDGSHIRYIAFKTQHALYWISNTLLSSVSNEQMLAIARSTQPVH